MARARSWASAAVVAAALLSSPAAADDEAPAPPPSTPAPIVTPAFLPGLVMSGKAPTDIIEERKDIEGNITTIREDEPDLNLAPSTRLTSCSMGLLQTCPLSALSESAPSLVYPGGNTSCLEGGSYAFRVFPGDADKLYIHFQGGGACWDEATTMESRSCKDGIKEHPSEGIFNKTDPENPLQNFTIVQVIDCSGDLLVGTARQAYGVSQMGYYNANSALAWAKENMPEKLQYFAVGGDSTGSLAAQIWSDAALNMFSYDRALVLLDSYMPIFPAGADNQLLLRYGACETLPLPEEVRFACTAKNLSMTHILQHQLVSHPNATFAIFNSKADAVQRTFADMFNTTLGLEASYFKDEEHYYRELNVLSALLHSFPNVLTYFVGGDCAECHVFLTNNSRFENLTAAGTGMTQEALAGGVSEPSKGTPAQWLRRLMANPENVGSACMGEVLPHTKWASDGVGIKWCPNPYMKLHEIKQLDEEEEERQQKYLLPFALGVVIAVFAIVVLAGVWWYCRFRDPKEMCEALNDEDSDFDSEPLSP